MAIPALLAGLVKGWIAGEAGKAVGGKSEGGGGMLAQLMNPNKVGTGNKMATAQPIRSPQVTGRGRAVPQLFNSQKTMSQAAIKTPVMSDAARKTLMGGG
jgi:hypothetical protein